MKGDDDWFTLAELTARLGGLLWVERSIATVIDSWSRIEADPALAVVFAATAGHHRWHSDVLQECMPTSEQLLAQHAIGPPTEGWQRSVEVLAELQAPDAGASRLRSLVRHVDPWLARETDALVSLANPVSDAAMSRWLRFVRMDHHDDSGACAVLLGNRRDDAIQLGDHQLVQRLNLR